MSNLWIFDLDGTLTDSFPVFTESMEGIFRSHGKTFTDDHLREILGCDADVFFTKHLGESAAKAATERLVRSGIEGAARVKPYEGIEDVLKRLRAAGRDVSVWTGRDLKSAKEVLKASGLGTYVTHCVSGSCVRVNKPDPEGARRVLTLHGRAAQDAVMIGDHLNDMMGAKALGLVGVRVKWNKFWTSERCKLADHEFDTVEAFAKWVDGTLRQ